MAEIGKMKVEKFARHIFQLWKMKMENYLYQKDLWNPLEGRAKKHGTMIDEDCDILDMLSRLEKKPFSFHLGVKVIGF